MPPRKRKIATIQQNELPRITRRSAKRMVSSFPESVLVANASTNSKHEVVSSQAITLDSNDNGTTRGKRNKDRREMAIQELSCVKDDASSSESEWEEVEDLAVEDDPGEKEPNIPKESIEITIELPDAHKKRRAKKEFDLATYVRRKIFRFKKEVQENIHKVHLLCLLGCGIRANCTAKQDIVLAVALSLIPNEFFSRLRKKNKEPAQKLVESLMDWYRKTVNLSPKENNLNFCRDFGILQLLKSFENGIATSKFVFVTMFLVCVRSIGLDARLIISLQPVPFKLSKDDTPTVKKTKLAIQENGCAENIKNNQTASIVKNLESCNEKTRKLSRLGPTNKPKMKSKMEAASEVCLKNEVGLKSSRRKSRRISQLTVSYNEDSDSDHQEQANKDSGFSKSVKHPGHKIVTKLETKGPKQDNPNSMNKEAVDSDEDFQPELTEKRELRVTRGLRKNRQALSSDEEDKGEKNNSEAHKNTKIGTDQWLEVYDNLSQQWICVDCVHGTAGQVKAIEDNATKPISYVLSFDGKGYIKDVTQRYASNWLSHARKLRVDADWWLETLKPYKEKRSKRDKLEDEQLEDMLLERPLPTTISDFKNHPLYALKRHLLKFEGIYPSEAVPVGFIRGEPIYARECVKELHSRETWLKEARLVRIGETAYKVVKARPKWIRMTGEFQTDLPLELFGEWQTDVYIPPNAENGKVPRNDYGNVELFKPSMLPKGTVHLQIPGLNRVAKKLGIDCAPAMIGWDFHGGSSHPTFDGWVVCKEFKSTLLEAWDEEQVNIEQREKEKREKRVYGNWRRLIRGLLIKEKIRIRYAIDAPMIMDEPQSGTSKGNNVGKRKPRKRKNTDMW